MVTLTMLDTKKSEKYDKFIEYLQKKGHSAEIPVVLSEEVENETGIKSELELREILDAMLERNIIKKEIGSSIPKFAITADQLKDLSKVSDECQNYIAYNGRVVDIKKISEEYKKQIKKWQEKLIELKIMKLTKFRNYEGDLPKEPECDYISDEDKINIKTEVINSLDKTSYNNNETLYEILRPENTEFKWNEFVDDVIDLKTRLEDRKEDIEELEKAAKEGNLTSIHFMRHNRALNLNREISELLADIGNYKDIAAKYGIEITYDANKISITSPRIPELKFESKLLSPELIKAIKKSEDKTFDDYNVNEPLEQEEFIRTIKMKKMMLPSSDEEVNTINEIVTILNAEGKTLTDENTTQMVLSLMDDGELKYYHLTVPTEDLSKFTALVSKSTTILESDNMVPRPKEFDESIMSVKEYEEYLLAFYTVYGLDKDYLPKRDPLLVQRDPYPHEATGIGQSYYTTVYKEYLKQETKITRVDNNDYIIGRLNKLKKSAPEDVQEKIDRLIALLTIPDLADKKRDGKTTDCFGFIIETEKIAEAKKLIKDLYNEVRLFGEIPIAPIVLPKDREPSQSVEEYEEYLKDHYTREDPHMVPIKDPLTERVRKPYLHECLTKDADGKLSLTEPGEKSYYRKAYIPYMASKGMRYTERDKIKGKPFSGRKVKAREDGLENKGVVNAIKKFCSKIGFGIKAFDGSFTEDRVKNIGALVKRAVVVIAIVVVVALILKWVVASGLISSLIAFPGNAISILSGTSTLTGASLKTAQSLLLCGAVGLSGMIYAIHKFRKVRKKQKYDHPDTRTPGEDEPTVEPPTPPLPADPTPEELERIFESVLEEYRLAKREYENAQRLEADATHTTEDIEKERKEKFDIKEEKKGQLVDAILEAISETEENDFDAEIGGMTL